MPKQPLQTLVRHLHKLVRPSESGPADDRDLLLRFVKRQDALAFAALVERHGKMVRGVCRRLLRQESDVDDAFQATFLVLLRKAPTIRKTQSLGSWLYGVAFRIASRARKASSVAFRGVERNSFRSASRERNEFRSTSTTIDPGMEAAWRELCAVLDAEVHGLAEKFRAPIVLCYLEGQTRDQAARQLGESLRTLDRRLEQGRERLRARLARRGITLSAALLATGLSQQAGLCAVPAAVVEQTIQAACGLAAGQTAAAISPKAIVLAETILKGALPMQLKVLAGVVLVAAVAVGGAGALAHQMLAAKPQVASGVKDSKPVGPVEKQTKNDGTKPARTDIYGDPLPPGAIARLGTVRFRHGEDVHCVAFTRGDERVISGGLDGIRVWDYASGKQLQQLCDHDFRGGRFGLSADDRLLAARGRSTMSVRLFDLTTGRELRQLGGSKADVSAFAFCPDSRTFAACEEKTIHLFDPWTGNELGLIELQDGGVRSLLSSPDGKVLAAADSKAIHLLDVTARKETHRLDMQYWQKMVFSLDGRTLYAGNSEGKIRVWNVASGEEHRPFRETPWVGSLALSPDGKMLAAGDDGIGARPTRHAAIPLYLWDVASGRELLRIAAGPVSSVSFSGDGKELVTVGGGHALRFWDVATGRERPRPAGHEGPISYIAPSPDGTTLITGDWGGPLWVWDLGTGRQLRQLRLADGHFLDLKFTRDGKNLLSLGYDPHTINLWDVADGRELRQVGDEVGDYYFSLIMSPDSQTLVLPNLELRALATGKKTGQLAGGAKVQMGCISPNGKLLAARVGWSGLVLWDLTTDKELRHWRPPSQVLCIAFTPDSKAVATGDQDQQIILWDAATGKQLRIFLGHEDMVAALAFSPDGRMLASGCSGTADRKDKTVRLWEVATGKERRCLRGHQSFVQSLAFAPDGRRLISGSLDGTVLVWDITAQSPDIHVQPEELAPARVQTLWDALAGADAAKAYEAIGALAATPARAVPFFKDHLHPVAGVDPRHIKRLIDDLNNDQFEQRERATAALATILDHAEPALRRKLAEARLSPEQRRRMERLLEDVKPLPPESLREVRAIEVLEHIGKPDAQEVLKTLATGAPEARLTQEAKAALERLARSRASAP